MEPPKSEIKISEITTWKKLLGVFLAVVEGLLGFWFYQAESGVERSVAGLCMMVLLLGFLYVVLRVEINAQQVKAVPQDLGKVTPAKTTVSEKEAEAPSPEFVGGPDRSYLIGRPPDDWITEEMTYAAWVMQGMGVSEGKSANSSPDSSEAKEVLVFRSKREFSIIPVPGETRINGRDFPSALEVRTPVRLSVVPIDRAQPPLFIDNTLAQNFLSIVGPASSLGLLRVSGISTGTLEGTKLPFLFTECFQSIEGAIVNDVPRRNIKTFCCFIGIEGELRDYLLAMNYPSPADANADLDRDLESLRSLVNSFRPLRSLNLVEKKEQMRSESDKKFKELLRTQGARLFLTELRAVMRLIHELNLDDPDQRLRAIKLLRPFELLAKKLEIEDDDLQGLWNSMHAAEVGEASDFKASTSSLFKELEELANPPAQLPPAEEIGAAESKAGS